MSIQLAQCWLPGLRPFPMPKYKYIFEIKYTEAILSNSTRKLLGFEISKMLTGLKNKFTASFIIILGTLSFPMPKTSSLPWIEYRLVTDSRRGSRILQGRVSNPSERGTVPPIILTHVTGTKQFFGLRRNSWRQAVVRHLELCQIPYNKFL